MTKRENPVQFILTIGVDNTISVQTENGDKGFGWGPGTTVAEEIIETLEDERML